jgi:hypothetical protein
MDNLLLIAVGGWGWPDGGGGGVTRFIYDGTMRGFFSYTFPTLPLPRVW